MRPTRWVDRAASMSTSVSSSAGQINSHSYILRRDLTMRLCLAVWWGLILLSGAFHKNSCARSLVEATVRRMTPPNRRAVTPSVLAAMHHPLRRRLLDLLHIDGPATASRLAEATGELVGNISHHLKVLASAGVIVEAPELAKTRRERWWKLGDTSEYSWSIADAKGDPAGELVAASAEDANLAHHVAKVRQWFDIRYEFGEPWVRAAYATERWLTLTPAQLVELSERVEDLVREYSEHPAEGEDAHRVFFFAHAVPARA
jgi:DNA-binding transcriptional ArsR family regulator